MASLRDSLLRALAVEFDAGRGLALTLSHAWKCCPAARAEGMTSCTCWQPVYDVDQVTPSLETVCALALGQTELRVRDGMCGDCAYRPDSPEKTGSPDFQGSPAELDRRARESRFFCHDGFRQPIAWRHPYGLRIATPLCGDYQPPFYDGIPYQADGQPGLLCAGWSARRKALLARAERDTARGGGG
jgi:hypothetical protein